MSRALAVVFVLLVSPVAAFAQQPCTTQTRTVVNELYRHMLERPAGTDSEGWVQHLETGRMTVREVVRALAKSPEHVQRFHYTEAGEGFPYERSVARLYRHLLERQPDVQGNRVYAELARRNGAAAVVDRLVDSAEYDQKFGDWGVPGSGGLRYCASNTAANQQTAGPSVPMAQRRFRAMDRNSDGVITRAEWRGSLQSFDVHDWNNDGVLSGEEINAAAARAGRTVEDESFDRAESFEYLDTNRNNRIELSEWHGTAAAFDRLDLNRNNSLSRAEMANWASDDFAAPLSGRTVRVNGAAQWTDTGIAVRAGDVLLFDAQGRVQLSDNGNDVAGASGATSGRRATDAPLRSQAAGALIARVGNSQTFLVGDRRSLRMPIGGRLFLGINDDFVADNSGDFEVTVTVQGR